MLCIPGIKYRDRTYRLGSLFVYRYRIEHTTGAVPYVLYCYVLLRVSAVSSL